MVDRLRGYGLRLIALSSTMGGLVLIFEALPLDIPFPPYPRITYDPSGIPVIFSLLLMGVLPSVYTALIGTSMIFFRGNVFGGIFKVIAELTTVIGFRILMKRGIYFASFSSLASRTAVMTIANYFLLPLFYGLPLKVVVPLLPLIAIFNLTQGAINIIVAYIIYHRTPPNFKQSFKF